MSLNSEDKRRAAQSCHIYPLHPVADGLALNGSDRRVVVGVYPFTTPLVAVVFATSDIIVSLLVATQLAGQVASVSLIAASLSDALQILGFYESINNQITSYFQDVASTNNFVARYENDPRSAPTDNIWCKSLVDFGRANQHELGISSTFRVAGNFSVRVINAIDLGVGESLEKADVIATAFRSGDLGRIIFRVPRVTKIGRIGDNHWINVTCPFFVDKAVV